MSSLKSLLSNVVLVPLILISTLEASTCLRCAKIEEEREEEKLAPGYEPVTYYEDYLEKQSSTEVADNAGVVNKQLTKASDSDLAPAAKADINHASESRASTLYELAGIKDLFSTFEGPFTLFIPTDRALADYWKNNREDFNSVSKEELSGLISNHVVPMQLLRADVGKSFKSLGGMNIEITEGENDELFVNKVEILKSDAVGNSGVAYVIDKVLVPSNEDIQ